MKRPDFEIRRDELRHLSELRKQVGLLAYPTQETIDSHAIGSNISKEEAFNHIMHEGERILRETENAGT